MGWISTSVLFYAYSKLYSLIKLSANDVKITSVDRQKLDLSKYYTYDTINSIFVEIQPDSTNIKNDPRNATFYQGVHCLLRQKDLQKKKQYHLD